MTGSDSDIGERRQYERLSREAVIVYRHMEDIVGETAAKEGRLCDFSGGGARFMTKELLTKNAQLLLNLEFSGWQNNDEALVWTGEDCDIGKLNAIGVVMWCSKAADQQGFHEIGVRFIGRMS